MNRKYFTPILLFLFLPNILCAQKSVADSLFSLIKTEKDDTTKALHLKNLGDALAGSKVDSAMLFYNQALALSQKLKWNIGMALAYGGISGVEFTKGDNALCIQDHLKAVEIFTKTFPPDGGVNASISLGNIGLAYATECNYLRALDYYFRALKLAEKYGDKYGISRHCGNIGIVYEQQGDSTKAKEYYVKALKMAQELKDKRLTDFWLGNVGLFYHEQNENDTALDYLKKALDLAKAMDNKYLIANWLSGLGSIYESMHDYENARQNYFQALELVQNGDDVKNYADVLGNLGILYSSAPQLQVPKGENKKGFVLAESYLLRAIAMTDSINMLYEEKEFELNISELYSKMGNDKSALLYYKKAMVIKDSLFNQDKGKEIMRLEMNREFEKKDAIAKTEQEKKDLETNAKSKEQKIIIYSIVGILLLIIFFSISLLRRFRFSQEQNRVIELQKVEMTKTNSELHLQKSLIEIHQKEIVDSINYAKRIQDAILPPIDLISEKLPNSFVLYKPKDIIAGDFYWMEEIGDIIFIAAADCTGHGVPGAMVSVVCSNALNRAVKEFHLSETGKILDKVTDLVLETFEKSTNDVKDGMDISLLAINRKSEQILWSGANNPLWYFQNGEFKKIVADKQPIGKSDHRKLFTTHALELKVNTTFYLFSDGYTDQFGGPKGKKFMHKRLQELLTSNLETPLQNQKTVLNTAFENWKEDLEQVDDVIVIGIRI